jgi:hypothetical protein
VGVEFHRDEEEHVLDRCSVVNEVNAMKFITNLAYEGPDIANVKLSGIGDARIPRSAVAFETKCSKGWDEYLKNWNW